MKKVLDFNGKEILFTLVNGEYWIAIKPLCEALDLEYTRQFKNIKSDKILNQLLAKQPTTGADKKTYNMACLPEKYIYGWLFSIRSNSQILEDYKLKCYDLLYNHFSGTIIQRSKRLGERQLLKNEIAELEMELLNTDAYKQLQDKKKRISQLTKDLNKSDKDLLSMQLDLGFN